MKSFLSGWMTYWRLEQQGFFRDLTETLCILLFVCGLLGACVFTFPPEAGGVLWPRVWILFLMIGTVFSAARVWRDDHERGVFEWLLTLPHVRLEHIVCMKWVRHLLGFGVVSVGMACLGLWSWGASVSMRICVDLCLSVAQASAVGVMIGCGFQEDQTRLPFLGILSFPLILPLLIFTSASYDDAITHTTSLASYGVRGVSLCTIPLMLGLTFYLLKDHITGDLDSDMDASAFDARDV